MRKLIENISGMIKLKKADRYTLIFLCVFLSRYMVFTCITILLNLVNEWSMHII